MLGFGIYLSHCYSFVEANVLILLNFNPFTCELTIYRLNCGSRDLHGRWFRKISCRYRLTGFIHFNQIIIHPRTGPHQMQGFFIDSPCLEFKT